MCKAFSCIVDQAGKVTWKLGVDSHSYLATLAGYKDMVLGEFAKVEITPNNNDYLNPDKWVFRFDDSPVPQWCGAKEKELCVAAHKKWLKKLDKFLNRHPIVHPFKLTPPTTIQPKHIRLLKKWDSAWGSVGVVWASVWASVGAYTGSFFRIPFWKYIKHPKGKYPYQPLVTLWNAGLVPSFDGTSWRLHGGPKAEVLFSITTEKLKKYL